jgi:MFS family permease
VGTDLGDTANLSWIVGGWSIASSVSFSLAGSLSDIFGRRYTIVSGEILAIIGSVRIIPGLSEDSRQKGESLD